ncbi:MAG TPA: 2-dehydro-3-deoxygalactonokinase [Burkholderiaceae bacterium]
MNPSLIALDWGTSNLRASLLDGAGAVLDTRSAAAGVMAVPERRFAEALSSLCGDWLAAFPGCACIASGMIGSRQGWVEAPYAECPAGLADAAARLTRVTFGERDRHALHIVPGLRCVGSDEQVDVMRGEETQLWGADLPAGTCCVLPGTHSKWAWLGAGDCVRAFQTHMTGELYAVLTQHSILGRLMAFGGAFEPAAFDDGVRLGMQQHAHLQHTLFAARTAGLMGQRAPHELPDFLSGMLIGAEIASARGAAHAALNSGVTLLGDGALCDRYARALGLAGLAVQRAASEATTRGQWRVALAAGLIAKRAADDRRGRP